MENNSIPSGPVPLPRNRATTKTPVPLPRTIINVMNQETASTEMQQEEKSNVKSPKPKLNHTNSLRKSLRRVTSNVHERSSAVYNSAKNVSNKMETSVRNILSKRHTVLGVEESNDNDESNGKQRCLSLPCEDVFSVISFGSPLSNISFGSPLSEPDSPSTSSSPPCYPPPPLPDESLYDEIRSNRSVFSEVLSSSLPSREQSIDGNGSVYEEVHDNIHSAASVSSGEVEDSGSFNYYDIPYVISKPRGHSYENVAIEYLPSESSQNIYSDEPAKPRIVKKPILVPTSEAGSVCGRKSLTNSCYENWDISSTLRSASNRSKRSFATKSVIDEFDPLFEVKETINETNINDNPEPRETVTSVKNKLQKSPTAPAVFDANPNPPAPAFNDSGEYFLYHRTANECLLGSDEGPKEIPVLTQGRKKNSLIRWSSMKRAIKMVTDAANPWSPVMPRKTTKAHDDGQKVCIQLHNGYIFKSPSNGEKPKDLVKKWCQLADGKITVTSDKNGSNKEVISLDSILTIQTVVEIKVSADGEPIICWEMSTVGKAKSHLLGCVSSTDAKLWIRTILESLTNVFPANLTADYNRAGQCFLKEGVSSEWNGAWILLNKRKLHYCAIEGKSKELDLRQARCIVLANDDGKCDCTSESGPYIKVHFVEEVLYLQMDNVKETKNWYYEIKTASLKNGISLEEQQITKDYVPVIVDKCISFIYAHGSMSEGIYRRSGTSSKITTLLSLLRKDAWDVQLSRKEYTEYDVSSVLKRFFRDLPEPLLTNNLHKYFCNAGAVKCTKTDKETMYKNFLEKLPQINYVTLRRLIGHLHFIAGQSEKNKMPSDNLAAIWAPTLMHVEGKEGMEWAKKECEVIMDLINNYKSVFQVEAEESKREKRILEALEKVHESPNTLPIPKPSGDLKISIYIGSRLGEPMTIPVGPGVSSGKICRLLAYKTDFSAHELCLSECILGGVLSRPLHHSELVLETVLKWAYWDSSDSKDNYLLLANNTVYKEIMPLTKRPLSKSGELKFADKKSKSFKNFIFEFSQAKLSYYKDKACSNKLHEWNIEEIIWYIGHEPKRNPQARWAITFIDKKNLVNRTKDYPYFGYTIAGTSKEEQLQWMATMLLGQYHHSDLFLNPLLI